jgi:hypothetical protein
LFSISLPGLWCDVPWGLDVKKTTLLLDKRMVQPRDDYFLLHDTLRDGMGVGRLFVRPSHSQ